MKFKNIFNFKKYFFIINLISAVLFSSCQTQISLNTAVSENTSEVISSAYISQSTQEIQTSAQKVPQSTEETQVSAEFATQQTEETTEIIDNNPYNFTICFAGDINLDENWVTTQYLNWCKNGIYDCISPELIEHMNEADIMCLNNEFAYSDRGMPLEDKLYTFRAKPERVSVLKELGVDIVKLANNHVYDYGKEAFLDTLSVLENAEIKYMGAGRNLKEAMTPVYIEIQGKKIAFVSASRAEKYQITPQATEEEPGILRCYDTALFKQVIEEADKNADFVIAYIHWGTEFTHELEQVQLTTAKEYLDTGADIIIGAHSHCLQGIEYYNNKPIVYSLGNYWFNAQTVDTMLLDLHFYGDDEKQNLELKVIPAVQANYRTQIASSNEEQQRIYSLLEDISVNIQITEEGIILPNE